MPADLPHRRPKRPLRRKECAWCSQPLERAAKGHCARIWNTLPDGTALPECFWVRAIREHGPHGALALSAGRSPDA